MGGFAMRTMLVVGIAFQATAGIVIVMGIALMTLNGLGYVTPR